MNLEAGEFTDYSFWRNEIQEAESIHDLFDICEELLEEIQIKADKNDLMKDLVVKAHICSKHYSDLLMHIDKDFTNLVDRIFHMKTGTGRLQKNNDKKKDDSINQREICGDFSG